MKKSDMRANQMDGRGRVAQPFRLSPKLGVPHPFSPAFGERVGMKR